MNNITEIVNEIIYGCLNGNEKAIEMLNNCTLEDKDLLEDIENYDIRVFKNTDIFIEWLFIDNQDTLGLIKTVYELLDTEIDKNTISDSVKTVKDLIILEYEDRIFINNNGIVFYSFY